jgi:AraC-like DNA-binding protein
MRVIQPNRITLPMNLSIANRNQHVVARIREAELYQNFSEAFQSLSGLSLRIEPTHGTVSAEGLPKGSFCRQWNAQGACRECAALQNQLLREASDRTLTKQCGLGLWETVVPVRYHGETIAVLRTGWVRGERPSSVEVRRLAEQLSAADTDDGITARVVTAFENVKVMDKEVYEESVALISIFSLHLATLIDQLILARVNSESEVVSKARAYIDEHLDEKLTLGRVAEHANVSVFYFCKVFKQATGKTFTEFVNQRRIKQAQEALATSRASVTEVAFEVGYQSLSQFNRCFLRYAGMSPSQYRRKVTQQAHSVAA